MVDVPNVVHVDPFVFSVTFGRSMASRRGRDDHDELDQLRRPCYGLDGFGPPGSPGFASTLIAQTDIDEDALTPDKLFETDAFLFEAVMAA
jgi:hypothetical protein